MLSDEELAVVQAVKRIREERARKAWESHPEWGPYNPDDKRPTWVKVLEAVRKAKEK